jgi:hypothetical protein
MKIIKEVALAIGRILIIALSITLISYTIFAWTGPTGEPPAENLSAPINSGSETQFKEGSLGVGGIFEALSLKLNPDGVTIPTCDDSVRGMIWAEKGEVGDGDQVLYCSKTSAETYEWTEVVSKRIIQAQGGDEVYDFVGDGTNGILGQKYRVHKFTTVGQSDFTIDYPPSGIAEVEYLIVGGGGGGSGDTTSHAAGGGGGGGGFINDMIDVAQATHTVMVGSGGSGGAGNNSNGTNGDDSSVFGITAIGGGTGANSDSAATSGGSGGGASRSSTVGGSGIIGQGNDGGNAGTNNGDAGGGGGAGSEGAVPSVGHGGDGLSSSISGSEVYYAGGGGGGQGGNSGVGAGTGGIGGGGNGGTNASRSGQNGIGNTGGGGGGGGSHNTAYGSAAPGGDGGSGIVVIRYKI